MNMHIHFSRLLTFLLTLCVAVPAFAYVTPEQVMIDSFGVSTTKHTQPSRRVIEDQANQANVVRVQSHLEPVHAAAPASSASSVSAAEGSSASATVFEVDAVTLRLLQRIMNERKNQSAVQPAPILYAGAPLDQMQPARRPLASSGPEEVVLLGLFIAMAGTLLMVRKLEAQNL